MATGIKEKHFEDHIASFLALPENGWKWRETGVYDKELCLIPEDVIGFIVDTQPKKYENLKEQYGSGADQKILLNIQREIQNIGTLKVFREKVTDRGQKLELYIQKPSNDKNKEHIELYSKNRFTIITQLKFSKDTEQSIDIVLFINGFPVVTAEVKNALTGQYIQDAIKQYQYHRSPKEPLFQWKRCLVHFAVSTEKVAMTTKLEGGKTSFLPFNLAIENPPNANNESYKTEYLWKDVWCKESLLDLIQNFIHEQSTSEKFFDPKTGSLKEIKSSRVIFPRYHQRRSVYSLLEVLKKDGIGKNYLVEHSAGSGKSNTIAWLAHRLSHYYYNTDDSKRMYDCILVVTDRRILDRQLQDNIKQFEQTPGVVVVIDEKKTSKDLQAAIEAGKSIIVTTLQKFAVISETIARFSDRNYAIIIDEAHSSQSGEGARHLKKALSLEEAEKEDKDEKTLDEIVEEEMSKKGKIPNASFIAFTATPKNKTMQLFGTLKDGEYQAFDKYSMEQAIKEGFILDVLQNYTTFNRYYKLNKKLNVSDKEYEIRKTVRLLNSFVDLMPHAIETKSRIMLEHFVSKTQNEIEGKARGMLVTRSRLHAVRYKRMFDEIMRELKLPYGCLVAFSGKVFDKETEQEYTEINMNNLGGKFSIEDALKLPQYRILIVANKYQTGFDEPMLHTMFVDKKLGSVSTVQTLSRLNRIVYGKSSTMVLDFVNEPEEVQKDFQKYYQYTFLSEDNQTDPNKLYDLLRIIKDSYVIYLEDLNKYAEIFFKEKADFERLQPVLDVCVIRFNQLETEQKVTLRDAANDYVRLYRFLSQIITFRDAELEKYYLFITHLLKKIKIERTTLPVEVINEVELHSYKVQKLYTTNISLASERGELYGNNPDKKQMTGHDEFDLLTNIIKTLNDAFGLNLTEEDRVDFERIKVQLQNNQELMSLFNQDNSKDNIRDKFNEELDSVILQFINTKLELYNKLSEDKANSMMKRLWFNDLYDRVVRGIGK